MDKKFEEEELLALQKEVALNYELGKGMMWTGAYLWIRICYERVILC